MLNLKCAYASGKGERSEKERGGGGGWLECFPWRGRKKNLLERVAGDSAGQMQSYPKK